MIEHHGIALSRQELYIGLRPIYFLSVFLISAMVPAPSYAGCMSDSTLGDRSKLAATVSPEDRRRVGSLVAEDIDVIVCSYFSVLPRDADASIDNAPARIGTRELGYLVLTETSLMFISDERGPFGRARSDVLYSMDYSDLNEFRLHDTRESAGIVWAEVRTVLLSAHFMLSRAGGGYAAADEVWQRLVRACGTPRLRAIDFVICN
jgi:hypothetical protein